VVYQLFNENQTPSYRALLGGWWWGVEEETEEPWQSIFDKPQLRCLEMWSDTVLSV